MIGSSNPNSAPGESIGKPTATPTFAEQVILFHGRYSRKKFWQLSLALPALLIFILPPLVSMSDPKGSGGEVAFVVMVLPFLWLYCKLIAHRLHDLDCSGWWSLLFVVLPILMYVIFFMLVGSFAIFVGGFIAMGCLRGTRGPNKYGPDPRGEPKPEPEPSA